VSLLGEFLAHTVELGRGLHALGLQLPAVVRRDLRNLALGLLDQREVAADGEFLRAQVLLLFDPLVSSI
jgi:hypothetical protein